MELQFKKTLCKCLAAAVREVQNQELTQEVRLTDGMPDIGRVLASWGQMILRSKEWRGNTVTVTGGVMAWVLYAPEDGTEPRTMETWLPFQIRWDLKEQDREGPVRISPLLRFVDSRMVSARKIMVRAGAAAMAEALYPMEAEVFSPEELPEDIQVLRRTYPVVLPKEAGEKTFLMDEDLTLPGSYPVPEKLLGYSLQPELTDCRILADKVVFRGSGNLHLIYWGQDGKIHTWDFELPFSQFSELDSSYGTEAQCDIRMGVTSLELDKNEQGQLRLKCGLVAQYLVEDRELLELTEDAYSTNRPVDVRMEELMLPSVLESRRETVSAEQSVFGQTGEIIDVTFLPDFPRQRQSADSVTVEIPGMFQILYYGEDGSLQCGNTRWEGSMTLPAGVCSRITARVIPMGRPQGAAGADSLQVSGQMQMQIKTATDCGMSMVTALEAGELREPEGTRPSLILCRPGSEDLWNLAKRCGSTMESIRRANALQEEPAGDRMLLIPVH